MATPMGTRGDGVRKRPMSWRRLVPAAVMAMAAVLVLLPPPAGATLIVQIGASRNETFGENLTSDSALAVYGEARATVNPEGGSARTHEGPANPGLCDVLGPPNSGCAFLGADVASAAGELRGDQGKMRARSRSLIPVNGFTSTSGQAILILKDVLDILVAGPLTFDINLLADLSAGGTGTAGGGASFTFHLQVSAPNNPSNLNTVFSNESLKLANPGGTLHVDVDTSVVSPFTYAVGDKVGLQVVMAAETGCSTSLIHPEDTCAGESDASHTAFLGITGGFVSENGYSYLGFQQEQPGPSVPEPSTMALLAGGLAFVAARTTGLLGRRTKAR